MSVLCFMEGKCAVFEMVDKSQKQNVKLGTKLLTAGRPLIYLTYNELSNLKIRLFLRQM